ncbi:MAG: nitroreductase family protein [Methanotrichaceae archaeon]|jgi:nitroreductase
MNLMEALAGRRSIRSYKEEPVSKDIVLDLIKAAETAPSAGNLRARKYVIVTNTQIRKTLAVAAYGQSQVETAPLLVVICADVLRSSRRYGDRGSLYSIQDAAAATMCLLLVAYDLGLGACWNGAFDDQIVKDALNLAKDVLPVAILSIGWPAESPRAPPARDLDEVVSWIE